MVNIIRGFLQDNCCFGAESYCTEIPVSMLLKNIKRDNMDPVGKKNVSRAHKYFSLIISKYIKRATKNRRQ